MYSMNIQSFADGQSAPTEPMHEASLSEAETTAADGADTADTAALRKAAYDDFIRRHKAEDEARLGALFKKRFRADKSALQRLSALEASFQSVMDAHGARSLEELSDRLSHGANRAASGDAQTAVSQTYNAWIAEAEAMKNADETFDLKKELSNPAFAEALRQTGSVRSAFRLLHFDDLVEKERKKAHKAATEAIRARGIRISEVGAAHQASSVRPDVWGLTDEELADISRRSRRGEIIRF